MVICISVCLFIYLSVYLGVLSIFTFHHRCKKMSFAFFIIFIKKRVFYYFYKKRVFNVFFIYLTFFIFYWQFFLLNMLNSYIKRLLSDGFNMAALILI